jgi:tRNA threonylcarbamoyl adenosine modification protein YeaZ
LVIDTATQALSVALFDDETLVARHHEIAGRGHAERLLPAIAALPNGGKADRIAVDVGPGSFTGVRIGVAAARALAFAWSVPVSGYSAMTLVAAGAKRETDRFMRQIAVAITGGHGELFWQIFDADSLAPVDALQSVPIALLADRVTIPVIHGSGAAALVEARGYGTATLRHPDSADFPALPGHAALPARPLYGRGADAKPSREPLTS